MKVLFITNYDLMYGANKSLFMMMTMLKNNYSVEPYLLVPGKQGGVIGKLCKNEGIPILDYDFRIIAIPESIKYKWFRKFTRRCMRYVDYVKILIEIQKKQLKFDIVHSNSSVFDIGYFLSKVWHVPHIWHVREFVQKDYSLEMVLSPNIIGKQYKKSACVIAISQSIYEFVSYLNENINLQRIYNGVNIPNRYMKKYMNDGKVNVCIVGSFIPGKNIIDVVKACKTLVEKGIENFRLYIVGDYKGSPYYEIIQNYIKENNVIIEHVIFTGYCENINDFLKKMDIGVMASNAEAFGRVTVEYMANYMAVIGTNSGGTPEVVVEKADLFNPHDIIHLADLLEKYIINPNLLDQIGKQNRLQAEKFTAERNADEIYKIYQSVRY